MTWIIFTILVLIIIGLILYWQLIIAEGAYLGAPLVALMYDWTAARYNSIKEFDPESEKFCLGQPLTNRLYRQPEALVLDVATGTGRIPLALFEQSDFRGRVIGLDRASKMLKVAGQDTTPFQKRLLFIQADAMALPFASHTFAAVTCLEALEFFPDPAAGLAELIRVLAPASAAQPQAGWLLTSNRVGWEAKLMPGKTWSRAELEAILQRFPLQYLDIHVWQEIYDLVWAQKIEE
jgi:ubiquinone/menaquinone biosynthesis C-methylase UbiE